MEQITLSGFTSWRIYYEDTDFSGYVYHANYLKYFERSREELIGVSLLRSFFEGGLHFVVARLEISYHRPLKHGDSLDVETQMILSESPVSTVDHIGRCSGEKIVSAKVKLAAVSTQSGEAIRVPKTILETLRQRSL